MTERREPRSPPEPKSPPKKKASSPAQKKKGKRPEHFNLGELQSLDSLHSVHSLEAAAPLISFLQHRLERKWRREEQTLADFEELVEDQRRDLNQALTAVVAPMLNAARDQLYRAAVVHGERSRLQLPWGYWGR